MSEHIIETRGARIACIDRGAGATALLFLHYWGGSARTWTRVVDELEGEARCVAIDQRGWGGSASLDGRYDLEAMADDVEDVVRALGLKQVVLVGHSMGGKVAQIVAARGTIGPAGLVLVAPAPPHAMPVPAEQRAAMLASYQSREGVEGAISILAGRPLTDVERDAVIADTLAGAPDAKREWTERGMVAEVDARLRDYAGPVRILVGERDMVERPDAVRAAFGEALPNGEADTVAGSGHLLPIEAPSAISVACRAILAEAVCR